jgi:hypothetical protein
MSAAEISPLGDSSRLLLVAGKNIGVDSTVEDMRQSRHHLSPESRMSVMAAALEWNPDTDILFMGGHTAGADIPSEAAAMKHFFRNRYPDIPADHLFTETQSVDTAGNAEEAARILAANPDSHYEHIGLISVGYHVENAAKLFRNFGIPVDQIIASEEKVRAIHPAMDRYVTAWHQADRVASERRKERVRSMMLPVDRKGKLLRIITSRSRG